MAGIPIIDISAPPITAAIRRAAIRTVLRLVTNPADRADILAALDLDPDSRRQRT